MIFADRMLDVLGGAWVDALGDVCVDLLVGVVIDVLGSVVVDLLVGVCIVISLILMTVRVISLETVL